MTFSDWLSQFRAPGESVQAFADRIGAPRNTVRHLLRFKGQNPSLKTMISIAKGLNLSLSEVCEAVEGNGTTEERTLPKPQTKYEPYDILNMG